MSNKHVYLESYGCTFNKFDLEVMIAYLNYSNYVIVEELESADILVINTCGVKKTTEDRILSRLIHLKKFGKPIVITGCLPKIDKNALEKIVPNYQAMLDPFSIDKISKALAGIEHGQRNQCFFSEQSKIKIEMPKLRRDRIFEIVPISEGCLGSCTFCCTRFARGQLFSYPLKKIVERINNLLYDGVEEFYITSQDTGAYGLDIESNLATLLEEICKINGKFHVRVGMMNPKNILEILDHLKEVYKSENLFKFIHLPVQSGSDHILKLMNRSYTISDFKTIVNVFRKEIPDISLSTDIICGFPGEDKHAFEESLNLIKEVEPDIVNISKFAPRPNTPAENFLQIPSQIVKARSKKMTDLCNRISLKRNKRWLNWTGEIFIDEKGKGSSMIGRNFAYKPIVVDGMCDLLGKRLKVRIREVTTTYLIGELTS